jgi:hypothetical protein
MMPLPFFLRRLTAPVEIRRVLKALDAEHRRMKTMGTSLGPSFGFDIVKPHIIENIFKWADDIKKDVAGGKPPSAVALWLTMNVARNDLYTGKHHIFPGRLSMPGNGVHALNSYCCDELEKLGQITADEKMAIIRATREEIRHAG